MVTNIFVNLPVKDLNASKEFFQKLGFTFNEQFTDETAACLVLGDNLYVMLLTEEKFRGFVTKEIADSSKVIESISALQVGSTQEVNDLVDKAISAGGKEPREASDYGFMYSRSFEDLDGHLWEIFYMDITKFPKKEE